MKTITSPALLLALLLSPASAPAQTIAGTAVPSGWSVSEPPRLVDRDLVDQHGRPVPARSIFSPDKPTVVSFSFRGCQSICPVSDLVMAAVDDADADLRLVTMTLDPIGDTPDVLARRATDMEAGAGWVWLTGDPRDVQEVNGSLGMPPGPLDEHPGFFLVAGPGGRTVLRLGVESGPSEILRAVALVAAEES